ncbi:MAG: hypothetical protein LBK69_03680 [Syntrophomonadaceae bacterium]|jgi:hypothetical protein|nr:hypothetical protein [Syntrophomonadaceae bacterium]
MFAIILSSVFFFFLTLSDAHAYLDPGSGGVLFQVIAAIGLVFAILWRKIKRIFTGNKAEVDEADRSVQELLKTDTSDKEK